MSPAENPEGQLASYTVAAAQQYMFEEAFPRLCKSLGELTDDEIWQRPNEQSNAMGNIVLHLCGNVRQWVITALGGEPDVRERDAEFAARGPIPRAELLQRLDDTMAEARQVIAALNAGKLCAKYRVQGFERTGADILIHVVEHFSYHNGQVAYYVKARKGIDLGFYSGINLNKTGSQ